MADSNAELYAAASDEYRVRQATLRATAVRDVMTLWKSLFNPNKPDASWAALKQPLSLLVKDRRNTSSGLSTAYYRQARHLAGLPVTFTPKVAPEAHPALISATQDATGIASYFTAIGNNQAPNKAMDTAGTQLSGSLSRLVLEAGRSTMVETSRHDPDARAWIRIPDGHPCYFCAAMASRGAVYHSAESAGKSANGKFDGDGLFKFHDHCACVAEPVFRNVRHPAEDNADALYQKWLDVQKNKPRDVDAMKAWRHYWSNDGQ